MCNILCLDLSLNSTGWSILCDGELKKYGAIKPNIGIDVYKRFIYILDVVSFIFETNSIDLVIIEDVFKNKNAKVFKLLCELRGGIIYICYINVGRNIFIYHATHARACFGLKDKEEVVDFISNKINTKDKFTMEDNDVCDSILLGLCFLNKEHVVKDKKMKLAEKELPTPLGMYIYNRYWKDGCSLKEIAKEFKVSDNVMGAWFNNLKIPFKIESYSIADIPNNSYIKEIS
jgi:Holliday junction resolvasome RuvABC endonuclease subunit